MPSALIVEDDSAAARALSSFVERSGFSSRLAQDWKSASKALDGELFDVVLLDVFLPGGSGIDLLTQIPQAKRPQMILMSGDSSVREAFQSIPMQALHFLSKPVDLKTLGATLAQVRRNCKAEERAAKQAATRSGGAANGTALGGSDRVGLERLVGQSLPIRRLRSLVRKMAETELPVYVEGESGTGKELVAKAIHELGPRADKPFVAVNCGALPESIIDSELFGYEKGAFTGADSQRKGVFEQAHGGTLFLDEIAEMPIELQVRLLRVLETGRVRRVGGSDEHPVDVRIVSATNRPIDHALENGLIREDLFHRLCVLPIATPPLRDRGEDILLLAELFLAQAGQGGSKRLGDETAKLLVGYDWPGNVRQLRNTMLRAAVLSGEVVLPGALPEQVLGDYQGEGAELSLDDLEREQPAQDVPPEPGTAQEEPLQSKSTPQPGGAPAAVELGSAPSDSGSGGDGSIQLPLGISIAEAERRLIERTLSHFEGDKKSSAQTLGVSLRTLYNRLNDYMAEDEAKAGAAD